MLTITVTLIALTAITFLLPPSAPGMAAISA